MVSVWWAFQACGWWSWLSLLVALGALALAAVALIVALSRARAAVLLAWLALAVALLPVGVGAAGMAFGRSRVNQAVASGFVDPSQLERIREEGYREAGSCVTLGGTFTALPLLLAVAALAAAYALRPRAPGAGPDLR
jgi:hypothetical protein